MSLGGGRPLESKVLIRYEFVPDNFKVKIMIRQNRAQVSADLNLCPNH